MELVEFFRARRALIWYVAIVAVIVTVILLIHGNANVVVDVNDRHVQAPHSVPLSVLLGAAMFFTAALGSSLGLSLNRENATVEFAWTRPLPREVLAARYIAIDLAALAIAFAVTLAGEAVIVVAVAHAAILVDRYAGIITILALGVDAMWYALLLALSAGLPRRGAAIAGIMWPASLVLVIVAEAVHSGPYHDIAVVLNVVNPFAYLSSMVHLGAQTSTAPSVWEAGPELRAVAVWLLAAAFATAATFIWKRREV